MTDFKAYDRQGREVIVHQLLGDRLVLVSHDGYLERREIISINREK